MSSTKGMGKQTCKQTAMLSALHCEHIAHTAKHFRWMQPTSTTNFHPPKDITASLQELQERQERGYASTKRRTGEVTAVCRGRASSRT